MALATHIASLFLVALEGLGLEGRRCYWEKLGPGGAVVVVVIGRGWAGGHQAKLG